MKVFEFLRSLVIFDGDFTNFEEIGDVYNGIMAIICVICAGLAAGLTIGLLSLDVTKLEIKSMTGNRHEKKAALQVLPVVKKHHLLLVTLLLFNSLANETLPIFLGALVPNYVAVILSVTLVLFFGEIIPSAIFTGPDQLLTAARMTGFVYFLVGFFYPIAYPISALLDYILGSEESSSNITRTELEALVMLQGKHAGLNSEQEDKIKLDHNGYIRCSDSAPNEIDLECSDGLSIDIDENEHSSKSETQSGLSSHEINLMTGILRLSKLSISNTMIELSKVYMLSSDTRLDDRGLFSILDSGFSRILVHRTNDKTHLMGYLLVKELIVVTYLIFVLLTQFGANKMFSDKFYRQHKSRKFNTT
jgi:metal transporter CNNM